MGYLRHPKTTQERRYSCDYQVKTRAKRNMNNIPNAWDDKPEAWTGNNWKKHRKTQYRVKSV